MRWAALAALLVGAAGADDGPRPRGPARTEAQVTLRYFHAGWCPSCRRFEAGHALDTFLARHPRLRVERVDVDARPDLVTANQVLHTPELVFVDGDGFPLAHSPISLDDAPGTLARLEKTLRQVARTSSADGGSDGP